MQRDSEKLSVLEKAGYSLGDCAANFVFQTQIMFLSYFYTDVFGISTGVVATLFLVSRLWDAVNDPIMGALADRTRTRWGRFRPWIMWTSIPFGVILVLAFTTPDLSTNGKIAWAYGTYILLMMVYTANNVPYSAMTGVITGDPRQRASLLSWRFIAAMTAAFIIQVFTLDLVGWFGDGDQASGFQKTMILFAVLAFVMFMITFATTKERVHPNPHQKTSVKQDLLDLTHNKPWIALFALTVFIFTYLSMRGSITPYYFKYYLQREDLMGWFNGAAIVSTMIGILFSKPLAIRFGSRNTFIVSLFLTAVLTGVFSLLPPTSIPAIFAVQILTQLIYGFTVPLLWSMMADVADYSEWKTGRTATAMAFAATMFGLKAGLGFGGFIMNWLLGSYGYVANVDQSESAMNGIRLLMSIYPAICFFLGVAALFFYGINKQIESQMHEELSEKRKQYQTN